MPNQRVHARTHGRLAEHGHLAAALMVALAATQVGGCSGGTRERARARSVDHDAVDAGDTTGPTDSTMTTARHDLPLTVTALDVETVASAPAPGLRVPSSWAYAEDGATLTYLAPDAAGLRQLYRVPTSEGAPTLLFAPPGGGDTEANLSAAEKLRRERQRDLSQGITAYAWAKNGARMLVGVRGALWTLAAGQTEAKELLAAGGSPPLDPRLDPTGRRAAFVRDGELWVIDVADGRARALTSGAPEGVTRGLAEFVAQEEMDRSEGYWWSHDGELLAYAEVDERDIPRYRIVHQGAESLGPDEDESHAYPFAGARNVGIRLFVVPARGGKPRELLLRLSGGSADDAAHGDLYLARVHWMPDGSLIAELEDRAQSRLELQRFSPPNYAPTLVASESSEVWINLHHLFRPLEAREGDLAGAFLWANERDGFQHLYLLGRDGAVLRRLTQGEWIVDGLAGVDEEARTVWFTGTKDGATDRHLYAVSLDGGEPRRITPEPGMHAVVLSPDHKTFIDTHSALDRPPRVELRSLADGGVLRVLHGPEDPLPEIERYAIALPELVTLPANDGTTLHGAIYHPPASFGPGPHPTIVSVYGGPHAQRVQNTWSTRVDLGAQWLAQHGFVVFKLDNRGSARRGLAFEGALRWNMGEVELADQVAGVQWLVDRGLTDPARVGIHGWSYGGFMAATAITRAPDTFRSAIAGAPVTAWDGYDTHYTERYMGTPAANAAGYSRSNVMNHVDGMKGDLMIVHGLIDENVHFRHSARLIAALVKAKKPYRLVLLPGARHGPRGKDERMYVHESTLQFFRETLRAR